MNAKSHSLFLCAVALIAGCAHPPADTLLPAAFPGRSDSGRYGSLHVRQPVAIDAIAQRPADLALLSEDQAKQRIAVSSDNVPNGRCDLPWSTFPAEATAADPLFSATGTPFWSAEVPAWVEVNLGEPCYVTQVVVEPYSVELGAAGFSVTLIAGDNQEIPVATVQADAADLAPGAVQRPPCLVASFFPKVAQRVRIEFAKAGTSTDPNVYIRRMRVLGAPLHGPFQAEPADIAEPIRRALVGNRTNLAQFDSETVSGGIAATGALRPGTEVVPWIENGDSANPFWVAPAPAAVTVDLGRPCYIDQVMVLPFSEARGVGRFYMKAITDAGVEVDTVPPCDASVDPDAPTDAGKRQAPFVEAFVPVAAQRLRLYFPKGTGRPEDVYVQQIQVLGIPAGE